MKFAQYNVVATAVEAILLVFFDKQYVIQTFYIVLGVAVLLNGFDASMKLIINHGMAVLYACK